jgi:hypothetical protein
MHLLELLIEMYFQLGHAVFIAGWWSIQCGGGGGDDGNGKSNTLPTQMRLYEGETE